MDPIDESQLIDMKRMYLGPLTMSTLSTIVADLGNENVSRFRAQCRAFLIEAITQIQVRFQGVDNLDYLKLIHPEIPQKLNPPSLTELYQTFSWMKDFAPLEAADLEWRRHVTLGGLDDIDVHEYWQKVFKARSGGEILFPNLIKIISALFSLPFSNAPVERLFSQLRLIKTDHRNSLKDQSLIGLLETKVALLNIGKENPDIKCQAAAFNPGKEMFYLLSKMKTNADNDECKIIRRQFIEKL